MHLTLAPRPAALLAALLVAVLGCTDTTPKAPTVTVLTPDGGDQWGGTPSPDGLSMAWLQRGAEEVELWVRYGVDGEPRRIAELGGFNAGSPIWAPDGKRLAYNSMHARSTPEVRVADLEADSSWALRDLAGVNNAVAWSPDGQRLVYTWASGATLGCRVHDLATGESAPLIPDEPGACGYFSPDGSRIAYQVGIASSGSPIWLADGTGANPTRVTDEGMEQLAWGGVHGPWSPDGTELLYTSRRTGYGDLWVAPIDGSPPRQLTRDIRDDFGGTWSPDGRQIAFVSTRGGQTDVWVVPASGGSARRLTDSPARESDLAWVPDGGQLHFAASRPLRRVWLMDLETGTETPLTPEDQSAAAPELTPDGLHVAYEVARTGGLTDLYLISTDGGTPQPLATNAGDNGFIRFAPDGASLTFTSDRVGNQDVWQVDTAGGPARPLVQTALDERVAYWSPDGGTIYFWRENPNGFGDVWSQPVGGGEPQRVSSLGSVFMYWINPVRGELYLGHLGETGQAMLTAVDPATGRTRPLWTATAVADIPRYAVSRDGSQLAFGALAEEGGVVTQVINLDDGTTRQVGARRTFPDGLAPDGDHMMLRAARPGQFNPDLQLISLADGSTRWLTETPEWEGSTRWLPDGKRIVFVRRDLRGHLAVVSVPPEPTPQ